MMLLTIHILSTVCRGETILGMEGLFLSPKNSALAWLKEDGGGGGRAKGLLLPLLTTLPA